MSEKVEPVQPESLLTASTYFKKITSKKFSLNTYSKYADLQLESSNLSESSLVEKPDEMSTGPGLRKETRGSSKVELEKDTSSNLGVESARSVNCEKLYFNK